MYVPKIKTLEGPQPITMLPNDMLLRVYMNSDASPEDTELARGLYDLGDLEYAGAVLRCALDGGRLVIVYPGLGQKEPEGGRPIVSVPDGALYLVTAPSAS